MVDIPVANGHSTTAASHVKIDSVSKGASINQDQPPPKRPPRKKGPNYAQIHNKPLPLDIYPLPAFHPSNPISLLRLCYAYLSQVLTRPSSHPAQLLIGHFDEDTRSIHVTDPAHVRALWEMGFFGKASLSRSEPTWLDREKARLKAEREGEGEGQRAAEVVTSKRREERRLFKLERARAEREKIERQRAVESGLLTPDPESVHGAGQALPGAEDDLDDDRAIVIEAVPAESASMEKLVPDVTAPIPALGPDETVASQPIDLSLINESRAGTIKPSQAIKEEPGADLPDPSIQNQEHLQLTLEEAFFLSFALGVLDVRLPDGPSTAQTKPIDLLKLFAAHSSFPSGRAKSRPLIPIPSLAVNSQPLHARAVSHAIASAPHIKDPTSSALRVPMTAAPLTPQPQASSPQGPAPDNTFLLNYVVYHHFRSLGWVVRPGLKFGVDYVLYNRGPVFSHAEFAVSIIPTYTDSYWATPVGKRERKVKAEKDWWWLHCVNRVQGQVKKTLVLVYVDVPPPTSAEESADIDVAKLLGRYKVREFAIRRWALNRSRA
ncbi:tRNA splicing endonuclease subunit sen2 [Teratosphaeriaceae sp. CCFEE 6253]|nr:tRNA splicing endonuclease subunit sen2 [Teratosphaeriaceae sp. CCFEE 6253]